MPGDDPRAATYRDFQEGQHERQLPQTRASAARVFDILFEHVRPASILDVGCGFGTWLAVAREKGVSDIRGVEGPWMERSKLEIEPDLVETCDLEKGFSLGRRFDLVICTEVAEHLSEPAAASFIEALAAHGDLVLFSAAIPLQGGHHHVNERFADYWANLFAPHGFVPIDLIRPRIWEDRAVLWWLRQNMLVFANESALEAHAGLRQQRQHDRILSIVHPEVYVMRERLWQKASQQNAAIVQQYHELIRILSQQGTFVVTMQGEGKLSITRK